MKGSKSNIIVISKDSRRVNLMMSIAEKQHPGCNIFYCWDFRDIYEIIKKENKEAGAHLPLLVMIDMADNSFKKDLPKLDKVRSKLRDIEMTVIHFLSENSMKDAHSQEITENQFFSSETFSTEELSKALKSFKEQ